MPTFKPAKYYLLLVVHSDNGNQLNLEQLNVRLVCLLTEFRTSSTSAVSERKTNTLGKVFLSRELEVNILHTLTHRGIAAEQWNRVQQSLINFL